MVRRLYDYRYDEAFIMTPISRSEDPNLTLITSDWIHDYIKERVRVRKLHSIKGVRGWMIRSYDRSQGWILVFLIGRW